METPLFKDEQNHNRKKKNHQTYGNTALCEGDQPDTRATSSSQRILQETGEMLKEYLTFIFLK